MKPNGFTLAELLIALVILGVIATFTIPKVLQSQSDAKFNSIGKETAGMISGAFEAYKHANGLNSSMSAEHLTPFMNYVAVDSITQVDMVHTLNTVSCSNATYGCLKLHNGGIIRYWPSRPFGGVGSTSAIPIILDPDGKVTDGTTNGPGKGVGIFFYYDGKIRTHATLEANTMWNGGNEAQQPTWHPPWFTWN